MTDKILSLWFERLESGNYLETRECLKGVDQKGLVYFCPLAILAELLGEYIEPVSIPDTGEKTPNFSGVYGATAKFLASHKLKNTQYNLLCGYRGKSFKEISKLIKDELSKVT